MVGESNYDRVQQTPEDGIAALPVLAVTGCGVKSDLSRNDGYPRNYPIY